MDLDLYGPWQPKKQSTQGIDKGYDTITAVKVGLGKKSLKQRAKELALEDDNKGQFFPTKDRRMTDAVK